MHEGEDVSRELAECAAKGDYEAFNLLFPKFYEELRRLARMKLRLERPGHTLQPTALVHEVYLRLGRNPPAVQNRVHFLLLAGRTMRRILVDHARNQPRGFTRVAMPVDLVDGDGKPVAVPVLDLEEVLKKLKSINVRMSEVVEARIYADLTVAEIARVHGVSERTIKLDWEAARAIIRQWLAGIMRNT